MIIEALILIGIGHVSAKFIKIEPDQRTQNAANRLIQLGLAQLPNVAKTLQAGGARLATQLTALPSKSAEVPTFSADELEQIEKSIGEHNKSNKVKA